MAHQKTSYRRAIAPDVAAEISAAQRCLSAGQAQRAFQHLENAHILGQASTALHVSAHYHMLRWALHQHDWREVAGQVLRILGAASKTAIGLVPSGNTGGSNISPFARLPIRDDLAAKIRRAKAEGLN